MDISPYTSCNGFPIFGGNLSNLLEYENYLVFFDDDNQNGLILYYLNGPTMEEIYFQSSCLLGEPLFSPVNIIPFLDYNYHIKDDWAVFINSSNHKDYYKTVGGYSTTYIGKISYYDIGFDMRSSLFNRVVYVAMFATLALFLVKLGIQCINMHKLENISLNRHRVSNCETTSAFQRLIGFTKRNFKSVSLILIIILNMHQYFYVLIWEIITVEKQFSSTGVYSALVDVLGVWDYTASYPTQLVCNILLFTYFLLNITPMIKKKMTKVDYYGFLIMWQAINTFAAVLEYFQFSVQYGNPSYTLEYLVDKFQSSLADDINTTLKMNILTKTLLHSSRSFSRFNSFSVLFASLKAYLMVIYTIVVLYHLIKNPKSFFIKISFINKKQDNKKVSLTILNPKAALISVVVAVLLGVQLLLIASIIMSVSYSSTTSTMEALCYTLNVITFDVYKEYMLLLSGLDETSKIDEKMINQGEIQWVYFQQKIREESVNYNSDEDIDDLDEWETNIQQIQLSTKTDLNHAASTYIYKQLEE